MRQALSDKSIRRYHQSGVIVCAIRQQAMPTMQIDDWCDALPLFRTMNHLTASGFDLTP